MRYVIDSELIVRPLSHKPFGWERFTDQVLPTLDG